MYFSLIQFTTSNLTTPVSDTSMPEQTWKVSTKPVVALEYARGSDYVYGLTEDEVSVCFIMLGESVCVIMLGESVCVIM